MLKRHPYPQAATSPRSCPQRQRGVTLVEILVTVVVISIGLLGVFALQAVSLRNNYSSFLRGQATVLATDIVDRIRANRDNAASYTVAFGAALAPTSMHGKDVTAWKSDIAAQLPSTNATTTADGAITVTTLATGRFEVRVQIRWGERQDGTVQFETRTEV